MKKAVCISYVAVLLVLGTATFLDRENGLDWTYRHVYGAWWFIALWWILALAGTICFIRHHVRRKSVVVLHASLVTILAGAFVSHMTGRSGNIHLRVGHPQNLVEITHNGRKYLHRLNYDITLQKFEIIYDENGKPKDFCSEFVIDGKKGKVSMNRIFRHGNLRLYQCAYDDDLSGSTLAINRDPYGIPITYAGYLLLLASLIHICTKRWISYRIWLACLLLTAVWCIYYFILDGSWADMPVLRSPLLFVHVVTVIMAYMLFLVQAVVSAVWLMRSPRSRSGHLTANTVAMLRLSIAFLASGIILGAVWANVSWGSYWGWDSKEVWALITFMIYAIPAHRLSLPAFNRPKIYHGYMVFAFLSVIMTYFGVNYCLGGLHSYI